MADKSTRTALEARVFRIMYRPLIRRAAWQILLGRVLDPDTPEKGRWLRQDVTDMPAAIRARRVRRFAGYFRPGAFPPIGQAIPFAARFRFNNRSYPSI